MYAAEKKAYVDGIMPYLYKRDKALKIKAMEAIEKQATGNTQTNSGCSQANEMKKFFTAATGKKDDALLIISFIEDKNDVYTTDTFKEILSYAAKLGNVKGQQKNDANVLLNPIRRLTKSNNEEIAQAAKGALNTILNKQQNYGNSEQKQGFYPCSCSFFPAVRSYSNSLTYFSSSSRFSSSTVCALFVFFISPIGLSHK